MKKALAMNKSKPMEEEQRSQNIDSYCVNTCGRCGAKWRHPQQWGEEFLCGMVGEACKGERMEEEEEPDPLDYMDELNARHELLFKAELQGLTKIEKADLFISHGLEPPKEGELEVLSGLLKEMRNCQNNELKELMKSARMARANVRYLNGETVELAKGQKYHWEKKESHEQIRATTVHIQLQGNSSKARRDQRADDVSSKKAGASSKAKAGPVSSVKKK